MYTPEMNPEAHKHNLCYVVKEENLSTSGALLIIHVIIQEL